jgi:hypothetical protein
MKQGSMLFSERKNPQRGFLLVIITRSPRCARNHARSQFYVAETHTPLLC